MKAQTALENVRRQAPDVVGQLQQMIYAGVLKPGERLNEVAIAADMGLSRGPVREAIKVLAGKGLVTAVANKGVFVKQLSVKEMLEVYDLRAAVFGMAAALASELITPPRRAKLERLLEQMDQAEAAEASDDYYDINLRFHSALVEASSNSRAVSLYDVWSSEMHVFRRSYFSNASNMRRSNREHRAIVRAVLDGDPEVAGLAAEAHVLGGKQRFLATLHEAMPFV